MNFNLSASLNVFKLVGKPSLCLPHATVSTFNDLPIPLDKAIAHGGRRSDIKAVVLDKDDCFAYPERNDVFDAYKSVACIRFQVAKLTKDDQQRFEELRKAYPGRRLLIVSNTAGALSYDPHSGLASDVEKTTGVTVLSHRAKKPGCGAEILAYFRAHPETGVTGPQHIAVVGDRLTTDMMMANMMGSWGVWVKDGVVPLREKSVFSRMERPLASFLLARGYSAPEPKSPFE